MGTRLLSGVCVFSNIRSWGYDFELWSEVYGLVLMLTRVIELRIHDEIERGDNDSIKVDGKDVKIHKACSS